MKPYYETSHIKLFNKDCRSMDELPDESVDLLVTDPPYQLSTIDRFKKPDSGEKWNVKSGVYHRIDKGFMGQEWDVLPPVEVWQESLRVLKPGAFAFIMTTPRQDSLCQILSDLTNAGFHMGFSSIYWAYASGFPKAQNIGKKVDKRLGAEREIVGYDKQGKKSEGVMAGHHGWAEGEVPITKGKSPLEGAYGGFQPKPAVEVIIVAMKPLSEKTFIDQALKNRKGITWLDDCRIPYETSESPQTVTRKPSKLKKDAISYVRQDEPLFGGTGHSSGRFPANLLVSDDVLNDGKITKSGQNCRASKEGNFVEHSLFSRGREMMTYPDSGSFSRYFDLDKWWAKTFPFLIVPKASKSEKNRGLEGMQAKAYPKEHYSSERLNDLRMNHQQKRNPNQNYHPTVKPVKLMAYLITLGSREGDTVVDNFSGTGTTAVAAQLLGRKCVMYEIDDQYCEMTVKRCSQMVLGL